MARFKFRNKDITMPDDLYAFLKGQYFAIDDDDCVSFITTALTTGDFTMGFTQPNVEKVIANASEQELSRLITSGAQIQKKAMV